MKFFPRRARSCLLALSAFASTSLAATAARADTWTVLVYLSADNNLEPYAIDNIQQMMNVGTKDNVKVAIQLDRSLKYSTDPVTGVANYNGTKRLRIDPGKATELQDLGNPDGTQPAAIGDFIKWGMTTLPSDHYAVVFWDHGAGWKGCCEDEHSPGRDFTPLNDIGEGLRLGLVGAPVTKLDVIGFDECLMAGLEVASAVQPYGKMMVSSAETEGARGWDYEPFLASILANPSIDAAGVGKAIADGYAASAKDDSDLTLSVVDLEKIPSLVGALDGLSDLLSPAAAIRTTWTPIARSRAAAEKYGASGFSDPLQVIDLGNFVDGVGTEAAFQSAAGSVKEAMSQAVVYNVVGSGHATSSGLSIHLPQKGANVEYAGIGYAQTSRWPAFIAQYALGSGSDIEPPDLGDPELEGGGTSSSGGTSSGGLGIPTIIGPFDLSSLSTSDDLDLANLLLSSTDPATGASSFLGALPALLGDGKVKAAFDGKWPSLDDGVVQGFAPFFPVSSSKTRGGGEQIMLAMPADLSDAGGYRPGVVLFRYDPAARSAEVSRAYSVDVLKGFGPVDITQAGTKVRPYAFTVQSFGLPTAAPGTTEYEGASLGLKTKSLAKGGYNIGFVANDLAGNFATKQIPVNVDVPQDSPGSSGGASSGNTDGEGNSADGSGDSSTSTVTCSTSPALGATGTALPLFGLAGVLALLARRRTGGGARS